MKKLFIGCLVLVALLVGGGAWVVYQVMPSVQEAFDRGQKVNAELVQLETEHPFEQPEALDPARFAAFLDLRVALGTDIEDVSRRMKDLHDSEDTGWLDMFKGFPLLMVEVYEAVPARLAAAQMGPTEFSWDSRLLYAALEVPGTGPEARDFSEKYGEFKAAYKDIAKDNDQIPQDPRDLIGTFDPKIVTAAREVMAADASRTLAALADPGLEIMLMDMPSRFAQGQPAADELSTPSMPAPAQPDAEPVPGETPADAPAGG
ncbi:MAG: hypothetical protein H6825_06370 [Planctomycetes bacterium]|nr:hypothetical protein [Planctomycetota bacterium]